MKKEFKKAAVIIAAAVMAFSMYSCGSDSSDKKDSSETTEVTTTAVTSESEETTAAEDSQSDPSDSATSEEDVDVNSLKYDFSGLKTEKYIKTFMGGRYKMIGQAGETGASQEAYIDVSQNKMLLKISYLGQNFSMFIDNGKQYTILDKSYFKGEEDQNMMESIAPFKKCGYVKSGEKNIAGSTYYFDEYYDTDSSLSMKIIVDKDGNLYGMEQANVTTEITDLSPEFDDSVFNVLDGCTETSQEEFMNLLMGSGSSGDTTPAE